MKMPIDKEWYEKRAAAEGDHEIGAGARKTMTLNLTDEELDQLERLVSPSKADLRKVYQQWEAEEIEAIELIEAVGKYLGKRASQPPQSNVLVSPNQDRMIRDIVRSAYDKGYNDARNVSAVPGDNSPGYRGQDVEKAHADELIARFKRLHTVAASRSSQSSAPPLTYVAPEIDGGRFEQWSLADFAAQCRMQSREQLDPEFSRFMAALASRLSKPSGIKVKPLRFEEAKAGIWTSGLVLGGEYRIMLTAGEGFQVSRGMIAVPDNQTWFPLLEIAEAAAFADYSARIMSAIEPAGVGVETESQWRSMDSAPTDGTEFIAVRRWPSGTVDAHVYKYEGHPNYWHCKRDGVCIRPDYQQDYLWSHLPLRAAPPRRPPMTELEPVAWKWEEYFTDWGKDHNGEYKHSPMWDDEKPADHPDIRDVTPLVTLSSAQSAIAEARDKALEEAARVAEAEAAKIRADELDRASWNGPDPRQHVSASSAALSKAGALWEASAAIRALKEKP